MRQKNPTLRMGPSKALNWQHVTLTGASFLVIFFQLSDASTSWSRLEDPQVSLRWAGLWNVIS